MNCLNRFRPNIIFLKRSITFSSFLRARFLCSLSIILCTLMLMTSCSLPWSTQGTTANSDLSVIGTDEKTLDKQSLVRQLAECISDTAQIENVYNSIPTEQLDGLSFASFSSYIVALTYLHTDTGAITSFRFLTESENKTITDAIAVNAVDYQPLLASTIPVELFYGNQQSQDPPVYMYIQEDANGTAYLSSTWVKECLNVFDFAGLYFTALEKQNTQAVASLINDSQVPAEGQFSTAVVNYKAGELVQYYHLKVQSPFVDYRLISMDISQLSYLQPEVLDDISLSYQTRTVRFVRNSLNNISIRDSVNNPLTTKDFYLYYKGEKTIRIGDRADSNQFINLFGEPALTVFSSQFSSDASTQEPQQMIVISYGSTSVTIKGTVYKDDSWDGQIIQIRLNEPDSNFVLGKTIYAGMSRDELMLMYPFADQTDYILTTTQDEQKYVMSFVFAEDKEKQITGVTLELPA